MRTSLEVIFFGFMSFDLVYILIYVTCRQQQRRRKSKGVNSTYWKDNGQSTMQRKLLFCVLCFHIPFVRKSELHYFLVGHLFFSTMPIFIIAQLNIWRDVILNIWSQYEIISWLIRVNYSVLKWKLSVNPFINRNITVVYFLFYMNILIL